MMTPGLPQWHSGKRIRLPMQETWLRSLGWEDPLEEEMATCSSILTWKIPLTVGLVGYSPWGRKELDTTEHAYMQYLYS